VTHCIIVADGWPAWIFLCGALCLQCLAVFTAAWDHPRTLARSCSTSGSQIESVATRLVAPIMICTFLVHHASDASWIPPDWLSRHRFLWSGLTTPSPSLPFSHCISYLDSGGGVLDMSCCFYFNMDFQRSLLALPPSSVLQIVSHVTRCNKSHVRAPPERSELRSFSMVVLLSENEIDCYGLLPWDHPTADVLCPSVFSPTRWVLRPLTATELCRAFDVPSLAVPKSVLSSTSVIPLQQDELYPGIDHPPLKMLQRAFMQWFPDVKIQYLVQSHVTTA